MRTLFEGLVYTLHKPGNRRRAMSGSPKTSFGKGPKLSKFNHGQGVTKSRRLDDDSLGP
jgi:hypothetical protein